MEMIRLDEAEAGKHRVGWLLVAALAGALLSLTAPTAAHAQLGLGIPLSVEVRAGGAFPTGDFAEETPGIEAEAGAHFEAAVAVRLMPALAVYGGYSWSGFGCSRCEERGIDDPVVDSGFDFGLEASLPVRVVGVVPWVRAGGVLHQLTFSGFDSSLDSERALGFRVGGGISIPVMGSLTLVPGVSYSAYSAELDLGALDDRTIDVTHLTAGIGLRYTF